MPTVPRYQRQIAPQQLPSGALRAVETPTSAGVGAAQARAQIGRGVQEIGGAVAGIGEKFLNIAYSARAKEMQEAKDYADQLAVLGANNKLSNFERTLYADGGAFTLQGEAAFHLPETVNASFDKTADEIEFGLTNPEQKLAFARLRSQRGQSIALDVERHVSGEIKQFAATELQASKANNGELAMLKGGAGDFTRAGEAMDAYANDVRTIGKRLGMPDEAIDADIYAFRSTVHEGIIYQLLADNKTKTAKLYFDETKDQIAGDKRDDVIKALSEGNTRAEAQAASDKILAEGGTLTEQRAKAKAIEDPDVRDATLTYLEHEDTITKRAKGEAEENASKGLYDTLERNGGNIKAIMSTPAWHVQLGDARRSLQIYAEHIAGGTQPDGDGGAMKVYYGLRDTAQRDPETFKNLNLYDLAASRLPKTEFKQLTELQMDMRAGKASVQKQLTGYATYTQIFNKTLEPLGFNLNGKEAAAIQRQFEHIAAMEGEKRGRELTNVEIQTELDRLVMIAIPGHFFGPSQKRGFELTVDDIPQALRQQIYDTMRRNNVPLTQDGVLDRYRRYLQEQQVPPAKAPVGTRAPTTPIPGALH